MAKFKTKAKRAGKKVKRTAKSAGHATANKAWTGKASTRVAKNKAGKSFKKKTLGASAVSAAAAVPVGNALGKEIVGVGTTRSRIAGAVGAGIMAGAIAKNQKDIKKAKQTGGIKKVNRAGGYTTYKRKTAKGKTITVKRKVKPKQIARKSARKR